MIVDHQTHFYPKAYFESIVGRSAYPRAQRTPEGGYRYELIPGGWQATVDQKFWEPELQLADMDADGIGVAVLSANMLAEVAWSDLAEAREVCELLNSEMARVQREYPARFVGLATLPMQDAATAIEVLDQAITELSLRGVCILSNIAGGPITGPDKVAIYQRIDELGVPLFLHPANDSMLYDRGLSELLDNQAGWMYDTTAAALSLIYSGTLDECKGLQVVHPHAGGTVPYVRGRVADGEGYFPTPAKHTLEFYLREHFYADTVSLTPGALEMTMETYGRDRLVFATDYPWYPRSMTRDYVDGDIHGDDLHRVLHENRVSTLALPSPESAGAAGT